MRTPQITSGQNVYAQQFDALRADARGASFLLAQQMLGYFSLGTAPTNGQTFTVTVNGTAIVLTAAASLTGVAGQVLNPGTAAGFVSNALALLQQPQTTTSTGVALSSANQQLLSYLTYAVPTGSTTLYLMSNNSKLYAPLTSFSASTTATSGTWTTQTMQLYVHAGTVYVNGTRILWTGGSTPTVTAPVSHPRIDVLAVNGSGTLAWTTGTEASSPSAPTYPADQVAICELYNVVSETALYDGENQQSGQGYIYNDVRPVLGERMNWTAFASDFIPDADGTRNLGSASKEWENIYIKNGIFLGGSSVNSQTLYAATAAEPIAAAAAVAAGYYQSDGGIGIDSIGGGTATGSSGNYTYSIPVGSGNSNAILLVLIRYRTNTSSISAAPQWNGSNMTNMSITDPGGGSGHIYGAYIVNPTPGTHNLTFTTGNGSDSACVYYASLYNVNTSSPIDNSASSGGTSVSMTPNAIGAFVIGYSGLSTGNSGAALSWENVESLSSTGAVFTVADANKAFPLNSFTVGGGSVLGLISIAPKTAAVLGAVVNASAANTAAGFADNSSGYRCNAFLGFAVGSVTGGSSLNVITGGVAGGLTGLVAGLQYYLSNTGGAIATTAGSVARKVAIAASTTQALVTNIW